jgi:hypothetical protein
MTHVLLFWHKLCFVCSSSIYIYIHICIYIYIYISLTLTLTLTLTLMLKPTFGHLSPARAGARSLPDEWRNGLTQKAVQEQMLETPFVKSFVGVYRKLKGYRLKRQHLSLFAPYFPYETTMRLFCVGRKAVYFAKVHAGQYGGARPVPPTLTSYRISPEATMTAPLSWTV